MTTIVYSAGVLATDARSTNRMIKHKCNECDKITTHANDTRKKIRLPPKASQVKFRGELVRAITGAGSSQEIDHAIALLMRGRDIEKIYGAIFDYTIRAGVHTRRLLSRDCLLVILTNKTLYTLRINPRLSPEIQKHSLQEDFAWGSGGNAALLALQMFSCSAPDAAKAAIIADKYSGGRVSSFNVRRPQDGVKEERIRGAALQKFAETLTVKVKPIKKATPKKKKPAPVKAARKTARKAA